MQSTKLNYYFQDVLSFVKYNFKQTKSTKKYGLCVRENMWR